MLHAGALAAQWPFDIFHVLEDDAIHAKIIHGVYDSVGKINIPNLNLLNVETVQ